MKRIRPTTSKLMSAQLPTETSVATFTPKECAVAFAKGMDDKQRTTFKSMTKHCRVGEGIAKIYNVPHNEFMEELLKII